MFFQILKALSAALNASSRSDVPARATVPITSSLAGLITSIVSPEAAGCHLPSMYRLVFGYDVDMIEHLLILT